MHKNSRILVHYLGVLFINFLYFFNFFSKRFWNEDFETTPNFARKHHYLQTEKSGLLDPNYHT